MCSDIPLSPATRPPTGTATERDPFWANRLAPLEPGALTVLVDISNKCNIRCRMCHFSFDSVFYRRAEFMSPEAFRTLADLLFPYAHTVYVSAGCESMTSPHFAEILGIAGEYGIGDLKFLTNGLLMGPRVSDAILEAGMHQIHFSVDGATRATYESIRRGASFDLLLKNILYLKNRKEALGLEEPLLQFNVALMRSNLDELEVFVDLAEELGVTRISARHMMPYQGLDVAGERLSECPERANRAFRKFLARVAASPTVTLATFPDLFEGGEAEPHPVEEAPADSENPSPLVGALDYPREAQLSGTDSILFSGWALDRRGEVEVLLLREPVPEDEPASIDGSGFVVVGRGRFVNGARPDIGVRFPSFPLRYRNAWRFELTRDRLPATAPLRAELIVVAIGTGGEWLELGRRTVSYGEGADHEPYLFCDKPFRNVYGDSVGNIYPYPDCQMVEPFGALTDGIDFSEIWFGSAFTTLRQQIIDRDPPRMCLTCPDFINRNVDDSAYFAEREIESAYRRPIGFIEKLIERDGALRVAGWVLFWEGAPAEVVIETPTGMQFAARPWHRRDIAELRPRMPEKELIGFAASLPAEDLPARGRYSLSMRARRGDEKLSWTIEIDRGVRWKGEVSLRAGAVVSL